MAVKEVDGDMNVGRAVCVNSQKSSAKAVPVIEWLSRVESSRVESSSRVVESSRVESLRSAPHAYALTAEVTSHSPPAGRLLL